MLCPSVFMKTDHLWNHTTRVKVMKKRCKLLHHSMGERKFQSSNIKDNEGKIIAGNRTVGDLESNGSPPQKDIMARKSYNQ